MNESTLYNYINHMHETSFTANCDFTHVRPLGVVKTKAVEDVKTQKEGKENKDK